MKFIKTDLSNRSKKSEKVQISQSKTPGREQELSFAMGINIGPLNYSFMSKICFKLLPCTMKL